MNWRLSGAGCPQSWVSGSFLRVNAAEEQGSQQMFQLAPARQLWCDNPLLPELQAGHTPGGAGKGLGFSSEMHSDIDLTSCSGCPSVPPLGDTAATGGLQGAQPALWDELRWILHRMAGDLGSGKSFIAQYQEDAHMLRLQHAQGVMQW